MSSQNICSSNVKSNFILYNKKSIVRIKRLDRGLTFEENRGLRDLEFRNRPSLARLLGKFVFIPRTTGTFAFQHEFDDNILSRPKRAF